MSAPKPTAEECLAAVRRRNEEWRVHCKKLTDELTTMRSNQRTLIDLLADTMKRLREAEAALEEEKGKRMKEDLEKSHTLLTHLLSKSHEPSRWAAGAAQLCQPHPWLEARLCETMPVQEQSTEGAGAAAAAGAGAGNGTGAAAAAGNDDDDLYA